MAGNSTNLYKDYLGHQVVLKIVNSSILDRNSICVVASVGELQRFEILKYVFSESTMRPYE